MNARSSAGGFQSGPDEAAPRRETIGRLFGPGQAGTWDDAAVSCPVVRREANGFRMWYYGRDKAFPGGALEGEGDGIPMGRSGLAVSADGLNWERVKGRAEHGAVFGPSSDPDRFDSWQIGGTDVVVTGGEYRLYYQGARRVSLTISGRRMKGMPLCIGVALSSDGVGFERTTGAAGYGAALTNGAEGEWDEYFAGWPRVLPLDGGGWRMYYHGGGSTTPPSVGVAESADGMSWEKRGPIFHPNPDQSAFDARSVNTRSVVPYQGGYLMAYEALPAEAGVTYRIGLATSPDGLRWERLLGPGPKGCVLDVGEPGSWDALAIGTPYLVPDGDGFRLYYVGFSPLGQSSIGLALCDGREVNRWERYRQ